MGHGFEGPIITHGFYGTSRVVDDLARLPGWDKGVVAISKENESYDADGWVNAYRPVAVPVVV